jgi:transcriptional regulator with XRE-family HTH domain
MILLIYTTKVFMEDNNMSEFGDHVKSLRTQKGIGSRELSRNVGKAETYISQLERGLIKEPEYKTAFEIMKNLGYKEEKIENILFEHFYIKSPIRIEAEDAWAKQEEENLQDPDYQQHLLERQIEAHEREIEWLASKEEELDKKNSEIYEELSFFIHKNVDTFQTVIDNLHSIVLSISKNYEDYHFFTQLFKRNIAEFSEESKKRILQTIKEEFEVTIKNNGGWGKPPSF